MSRVISARPYGGKSREERQAVRRAALLSAARDIWAEDGWAAVTMRGVCARAKLTDRYFYESFNDRDALLVAVAERVRDEALETLLAAILPHADDPPFVQLRAALEAIVRLVTNDPASAQILFGDHGGSSVLELHRRNTIQLVVDLMVDLARPYLASTTREQEFRINVLVGIGGFVETITAWRSGIVSVTADELIEMLHGMGEALGQRFVATDRKPGK